MGTTTNPVLAKKAAVLDMLRAGAVIDEAAKTAGVGIRTVHDWAAKDAEFASLKAEAMKNRGRTVTEGQLAKWQQELADLRTVEAQANADLLEQAAPALAGDAAAQARQAELREQLRLVAEKVGALTMAIASAEQHLARAREQEAQAAREAAAAEDQRLAEQQRAAAAEVDAALAALEQAVGRFQDAAIARQAQQRKATGRSRPVVADRQVLQALFAGAPRFAQLIGADRRLAAHARPLTESID